MRRRGKRLLALALAGVMAASALTGCEKIEDTKAASGNTTAAKAADEGKAGAAGSRRDAEGGGWRQGRGECGRGKCSRRKCSVCPGGAVGRGRGTV